MGLEERFALGWRHYSFALSDLLPLTSNLQHLLCLLPAAICPLDSRFALHEIEAEIYPETDSK